MRFTLDGVRSTMKLQRHDLAICSFLTITTILFYGASSQFQNMGLDATAGSSSWLYRLLGNMFGYSTVMIPGYISMKYIRRVNYATSVQKGCLWPLIRDCIYGQDSDFSLIPETGKATKNVHHEAVPAFTKSALLLIYCFSGLQISYLTWGLLQEKIITQKYDGKTFSDSQFLVFVNRVIGLIIASAYISLYEKDHGRTAVAPLYKYSFCAFSNIMSSWFQYEALKFVSFPTQVLAKASKIIPVMLMGKLISKKTYEFYEYITAVLISVGMVLFLAGSNDYIKMTDNATVSSTSAGISGLLILILYMAFDSFTSNWQSELFRVYGISSFRMMAGVNLFSLLLTGVSLIQQGSFTTNLEFLLQHHDFALDCLILSICSAIGQLFIYYTIEKFGPVVFIIIMSIRQAFAILLSCIFFHHPITVIGVIGVFVIFFSLFLRIYCSYRIKQVRKVGQSAISVMKL